jgi:hypothetical protein
MSTQIVVARPLDDVIQWLREQGVRRLAVVNNALGEPAGLVYQRDYRSSTELALIGDRLGEYPGGPVNHGPDGGQD